MCIINNDGENKMIMATGSASPILQDKVNESGLGRWNNTGIKQFIKYLHLLFYIC
ncbi:MAG: hypothetical protein IJA69_03705 [Clostridia bacterium]|nr:hypothetical protein [Clostridia bacterium]